MTIGIWEAVLGIGIFQGVLLSVALLTQRKQKTSYYLIALVGIVSLVLLTFLVREAGLLHAEHVLFGGAIALWYMVAPLFWLYLKAVLQPGSTSSIWLHSAPFGAMVVANLWLASGWPNGWVWFFDYGLLVQVLAYAVASIRLLQWATQRHQGQESNTTIEHVRWVKGMIGVLIAYILVQSSAYLVPGSVGLILRHIDALVVLSFLIHAIAFMAIRYPIVLARPIAETMQPTEKYQSSSLSTSAAHADFERLRVVMETETLYLNSHLTIEDLAQTLGMSTHHVSQIINQAGEVHFYDYINQYRVEAVKARLIDPAYAHLSILALGLDGGFNSKSSFYRVFKQHTGMTPSTYRKQEARKGKSLDSRESPEEEA